MRRLVSFQSDYSRDVVLTFVVPCCLPRSRVLPRKGIDVPEGDLTQWSQIRDEFPLERSWLDLAVVDSSRISATFTVVEVDKITTKGPLQWGLRLDIPFLYPDIILWPVRVHGSFQTDRKSLPDPIIDLWESQSWACICCLKVKSPVSLRFPLMPLIKWDGHP
jgi:hypothetical protein